MLSVSLGGEKGIDINPVGKGYAYEDFKEQLRKGYSYELSDEDILLLLDQYFQ